MRETVSKIASTVGYALDSDRRLPSYMAYPGMKLNVDDKNKINLDAGGIKPLINLVILDMMCDDYDITMTQLLSKGRKSEYVRARQMGMYLTFMFTKYSLARIGHIFGGKDHATVLHARKTVLNLSSTDSVFNHDRQAHIETLEAKGYHIIDGKRGWTEVNPVQNGS